MVSPTFGNYPPHNTILLQILTLIKKQGDQVVRMEWKRMAIFSIFPSLLPLMTCHNLLQLVI